MIAKKKSFECFVCRCATVEERERETWRDLSSSYFSLFLVGRKSCPSGAIHLFKMMMMRLAEEEEGYNAVTHHFDLLFFLLAGCVKNAGLWWCRPARIGAIIASPLRFPVYNNAIQDDRGGSTLLRCKKPQQGVVGGPLPFFDCHSSVWYYPLQTVSSSYSSLWMYLCVYIYIHLFFLTLWARCYCCQSDGRIEEYPLRFFLSFFLFPSKVIRIAYAVRLSELVCHTQKKFEIRSLFFSLPKREKKFFPQQNDDCTHMWGNIEKIEKMKEKTCYWCFCWSFWSFDPVLDYLRLFLLLSFLLVIIFLRLFFSG